MMLKVRFQGNEYILTNGNLIEGPLATPEQYASGQPSHAHLFPDGHIMRYGNVIGSKEDLEILGEIDDVEINDEFLGGLLGLLGRLVMTVDPKVYALAESFVDDDLASFVQVKLMPAQRKALVQRAAEAMQQAIEAECAAIREELET